MRQPRSVAEVFQQSDLLTEQPDATITLTRHYQLITPLYGGGVEAGVPDHTKAISETTVRGHLRFWWRATRGCDEHVTKLLEGIKGQDPGSQQETSLLQDLKDDKDYQKLPAAKQQLKRLHTLEGWLFGCAAKDQELKRHPSKRLGPARMSVQVRINPSTDFLKFNDQRIPAYISFPLRSAKFKKVLCGSTNQNGQEFSGCRFAITLSLGSTKLDLLTEIEAACWAWETFGGVGARTRRGFGAIALKKVVYCNVNEKPAQSIQVPCSSDLLPWIKQCAHSYLKTSRVSSGVPHLNMHILTQENEKIDEYLIFHSTKQSATDSWKGIVEKYRQFRQLRWKQGRSRWPEPDAIRRLTGARLRGFFKYKDKDMKTGKRKTSKIFWKNHSRDHIDIDVFPRAPLSLPIIFHFRDDYVPYDSKSVEIHDLKKAKFDPRDSVLAGPTLEHGVKIDRFASPILFRVFLCSDGKFIAIAVRLCTNGKIKPLENLTLYVSESLERGLSEMIFDKRTWKLSSQDVKKIDQAAKNIKVACRLNGEADIVTACMRFLKEP
jgi:CRISPR-associated protein Cmr1